MPEKKQNTLAKQLRQPLKIPKKYPPKFPPESTETSSTPPNCWARLPIRRNELFRTKEVHSQTASRTGRGSQ